MRARPRHMHQHQVRDWRRTSRAASVSCRGRRNIRLWDMADHCQLCGPGSDSQPVYSEHWELWWVTILFHMSKPDLTSVTLRDSTAALWCMCIFIFSLLNPREFVYVAENLPFLISRVVWTGPETRNCCVLKT